MPLTCLPQVRHGLHRIAGCDNPNRLLDVVFIHGLGGDAYTTWMADPEQTISFWPDWLAEDLPGLGWWTLGYAASPTKWKEESMPLADRADQVLDLLANAGLGARPLVFITHSMGGIVAKQLLRNAESFGVARFEAIRDATRGIAFIATPHAGAGIASFAEFAAAVYRTNVHVKELAAHDSRLRELHGWFLHLLTRHPAICRTYCERREVRPEIPLLGLKLPKGILVVDETSAEPNIPGERAIPLGEDHLSICKPPDRRAQIYQGMLAFLRECLAKQGAAPAAYRLSLLASLEAKYHIDTRFVRLRLLDMVRSEHALQFNERAEEYRDLREVLAAIPERAMVLLGAPGCGKSTLLRRLQLDHARDHLEDAGGPVSLFVCLGAYPLEAPPPLEWLQAQWRKQAPDLPDLAELLKAGRVLLLLDALNEMPHRNGDDFRVRVEHWRCFLRDDLPPGNRAVFSCRMSAPP